MSWRDETEECDALKIYLPDPADPEGWKLWLVTSTTRRVNAAIKKLRLQPAPRRIQVIEGHLLGGEREGAALGGPNPATRLQIPRFRLDPAPHASPSSQIMGEHGLTVLTTAGLALTPDRKIVT